MIFATCDTNFFIETSVSATHEATLNDAVQELVDKPEQAFSAIGEITVIIEVDGIPRIDKTMVVSNT